MTIIRRTARSTLALTVGMLAVAGCSSATQITTGLPGDEVAARYGYVAAKADLTPVYALVPGFRDPADGYARDLLARECLRGTVEYLPAVPGASGGFVDERTRQWELTEEVASVHGYPFLRPRGQRSVRAVLAGADPVDRRRRHVRRMAGEIDQPHGCHAGAPLRDRLSHPR